MKFITISFTLLASTLALSILQEDGSIPELLPEIIVVALHMVIP
ncbi:hypothetical protein TW65_08153 [Stemphylium lycopersici]|uniref:Uncharacterized protein n=1 Tax=Stemphylium lycopersici TaxID=183478 RepID=A0A364MV66_STELY|nr:hypothetical protein TW65_08153 [Stemphylium lycopersici]RAR03768.1 hypothetical protein DDE83_008102 [Stemphylium lycopersici]